MSWGEYMIDRRLKMTAMSIFTGLIVLVQFQNCSPGLKSEATLLSSTGPNGSNGESLDPNTGGIQLPTDVKPDEGARVFNVGNGSGTLTIDGQNFSINGQKVNLTNSDVFKVKGGNYDQIVIKNISVPTSGKPVFIFNDGEVIFDGQKTMELTNINNVIVSGQGTDGITHGFSFKNNPYRAVWMYKPINNFTLRNMKFENIRDYVIVYQDNDTVYNGSSASVSKNLRFLNLHGQNVATFITLGGHLGGSNITGVIQNVEVAGLQLTNAPTVGTAVYLGAAEDYNLHNNYMNNINQNNDNHNGIFMVVGNGKFYNNFIQNHQGNYIRAWIASIIKNDTTTEIYNNIAHNSRRYSLAEIQVTPYMRESPVMRKGHAKIYNNTAGVMNTQFYPYTGRVLDVYEIFGGRIEAYNNLCYENSDSGTNKVFNYVTAGFDYENNNVYKNTTAEAVADLVSFTSLVNGVGAVKQTFVVP